MAKVEKKIKKEAKKGVEKISDQKADMGDFAVIETGGKQYLVRRGDKIKIEKIEKPAKGNAVTFDKVLLVVKGKKVTLGQPYIKTAKVKAEWVDEKKAKKITNVRYKSKTRRNRKKGHRQIYTEVVIKLD